MHPDDSRDGAERRRAVGGSFGGRVAGVLGTRFAQLASTLLVSFLLASLLGPADRGVYALVIVVPTTLFAIGQLGLPSAMVYHAGRGGRLLDLERQSVLLGLLVSAVVIVPTVVLLPVLERSVLRAVPPDLVAVALAAVPLRVVATLAGSTLYGRGRFRAYNLILALQSALWVGLVLGLVGVLRAGVPGALAAYLLFVGAGTVAVLVRLHREARAGSDGEPVSGLAVLGYGLRLYPATLGTFFGYRVDVFLLGWLVGSPSEIGVYAVAVSLAELVFNVPDAVGTVLFPRVAAAQAGEAHRLAPAMTRMTVLATAAAALALVPLTWGVLTVLLPEYGRGLAVLLLLLPGIVALSAAKVLTSYLSGINRLAWLTVAAGTSLIVNVAANLVLIPGAGILGAAAASLISYTAYGALMVAFASRTSGNPWTSFVVPRPDDARRLVRSARRLAGRPVGDHARDIESPERADEA